MKLCLALRTFAAMLTVALTTVLHAEHPLETREEFGTFFGITPYSNTLGLSLWRTGTLYESHMVLDEATLAPAGTEKKLAAKSRKLADSAGGKIHTDYSKMGLGTSLGFENNKGSALLLRARRQFQMLNESSEDATFDYVNDREASDSGSRLEAALMLDLYLDPLYNRSWFDPIGWVDRSYRFWLRTGFEINRNDLPGKTEVDQQKWFGLLNFQANPDQNSRFLFLDGMEITSPQIIQLGAVFEQNRISGEEGWHWIAGWSPVFHLLQDRGIFKQGFGLNKRMFFGDEKREVKVVSTEAAKAPKDSDALIVDSKPRQGWYTSFDPGFNFLGASDARGVVNNLTKVRSRSSLEKLREEQFNWHLKALLGVRDGLFELSYTVTGTHPISELGDSHIGQEVRADLNLYKLGSPDSRDWRNLKAYVSYRRGQFEPNFEDEDLFTAGVSLRF
ncbi:MAG: hypothetical protein ABMA13_09345 [Chthoniobacteraceae bacterium]